MGPPEGNVGALSQMRGVGGGSKNRGPSRRTVTSLGNHEDGGDRLPPSGAWQRSLAFAELVQPEIPASDVLEPAE